MPDEPDQTKRWRARPEKWWWISGVVLVPVTLLTGITAVVLILTTHPTEAATQIDLVKTALSVGAGTGGVVALVLAGRRQWHSEKAQQATERSHHATEHDATERRITELYGKAVEQLGSDKAPVRLGGLYALERLAQDNPSQRQTIVNVICAYLRMPYQLPGVAPSDGTDEVLAQRFESRSEEREVRLTAQRIITEHLRRGNLQDPTSTFWPNIDLDLTGAVLVDIKLSGCHVRNAAFSGASFVGSYTFTSADFTSAWFDGTKFTDWTSFFATQFGEVSFNKAEFKDEAWFNEIRFKSRTTFDETKFEDATSFTHVIFFARASFQFAKFVDAASFHDVEFQSEAMFNEAMFFGASSFTIKSARRLNRGSGAMGSTYCWVREIDNGRHLTRRWPQGWTLTPTDRRPRNTTEGTWHALTEIPVKI